MYTKPHNSDRCLCRTTDVFHKDRGFVFKDHLWSCKNRTDGKVVLIAVGSTNTNG